MKKVAITLFLGFTTLTSFTQEILISEIDYNQAGTDASEFIEIYNSSNQDILLEGVAVVLFNGSSGLSYASYYLDEYTIEANKFFTIGHIPTADHPMPSSHVLQNGPDAVALYKDSRNQFPIGSSITTTNLIDAIVYGSDNGDLQNQIFQLITDKEHLNEATADDNSIQRPQNNIGSRRTNGSFILATSTPGIENNIQTNIINPNLDKIKIKKSIQGLIIKYPKKIMSIQIYNISGIEIYKAFPNKKEIHTPPITNKGLYSIQIIDLKGRISSTKIIL